MTATPAPAIPQHKWRILFSKSGQRVTGVSLNGEEMKVTECVLTTLLDRLPTLTLTIPVLPFSDTLEVVNVP